MILAVQATSTLHGTVGLPSSKSHSIRAFLIAACGGTSLIIRPSDCDDALIAMCVAQALGAKLKKIRNNVWQVQAAPERLRSRLIDVGESGTALRFLLPLLALYPGRFIVKGQGTLVGRPNFHLTKSLRERGVFIKGYGPKESVPIEIQGGGMRGGKIFVDGTMSSQFISALLIACPRLNENSKIILTGKKLVSTDYITMTQQVLKKAGIRIKKRSSRVFQIPGQQRFKGLKNFVVPADYGLAAFLLAAGALVSSDLVLKGNLKDDFIQADGAIILLLKKMGVRFKKTTQTIYLKGPFALKGGSFSLKNSPDLVPIAAVLALFARGKTRIYDIAHARVKESDRISDLRHELLKVGAKIEETKNELIIHPQPNYKKNVILDPHRDHRLAMAFSVLGLKLGAKIKDIECTAKSYPGFVRDFKNIGARVKKVK